MHIQTLESRSLEPGEHHVFLYKALLQGKTTRNGNPYQAVRLEFSDSRGARASSFLPEFSRSTLPFLDTCGLTLGQWADLQLEQLLNLRGVQGIAQIAVNGQYANVIQFQRLP